MRLRLFKTRQFADAASKVWICDSQLREAFGQLLRGQADNLGGYEGLNETQIQQLLDRKDFVEIHHDQKI